MKRPPLMLAAALLAAMVLPFALFETHAAEYRTSGAGEKRVQGSGQVTREVRELPPFKHIRVEESMDVTVSPGGQPSLTLSADDNVAPLIETKVENNTLRIRFIPGLSVTTRRPVQIAVMAVGLESAALNGSGDLTLNGIQADAFGLTLSGSGDLKYRQAKVRQLSVNLAGSGDLALDGECDSLNIGLAGSGDIRAATMKARKVDISLAGSGDIRVHASDRLSAQIAGSGDVVYSGNPGQVTRHILGSGSVSQAR